MTTTENLRDWALHLATHGWPVFPLLPGTKRPAIRNWEHRATTDPTRITRCWHGAARFNIAVATGPARLVVLDLDPTTPTPDPTTTRDLDGATGLALLTQGLGVTLPPTYTVTTPRGGTHLYFRTPPGVRLRNTAGTLAPHIDTRADGGYVVAPGSVRPDGGYELTDDTTPPDLPAWLVQALTQRPAPAHTAPAQTLCTDPGSYVAAALRGECDRIRHAPLTEHNKVLSTAAYALGQLVGADLLGVNTARAELTSAAGFLIGADCDCTPTEVTRVIDAALAAGARNPRRTTPRTSKNKDAT